MRKPECEPLQQRRFSVRDQKILSCQENQVNWNFDQFIPKITRL